MIHSWLFWLHSDHVEESYHEGRTAYPLGPLTAPDPVLHMIVLMWVTHEHKWYSTPGFGIAHAVLGSRTGGAGLAANTWQRQPGQPLPARRRSARECRAVR